MGGSRTRLFKQVDGDTAVVTGAPFVPSVQRLTRSDVDPYAAAAVLPVAPDNSAGPGKTPLVKEVTANALGGGRLASSPYPCVRRYLCAGDSSEERIARS